MNLQIKSCGLTADYRPNVVIEINDQNKPLWYHTTFYKADAALEYLKDLYQDGIEESDINEGLWLSLQELQEAQNV